MPPDGLRIRLDPGTPIECSCAVSCHRERLSWRTLRGSELTQSSVQASGHYSLRCIDSLLVEVSDAHSCLSEHLSVRAFPDGRETVARHGRRARASRDGFTACLASRSEYARARRGQLHVCLTDKHAGTHSAENASRILRHRQPWRGYAPSVVTVDVPTRVSSAIPASS